MKIRNSFVSNSSSTSFCLLGIKTDLTDELEEKLKLQKDLYFEYPIDENDDDTIFIGIYPNSIPNHLTIREAKEKIVNDLKKIGIDKTIKDIFFMSDGGYSG